MQVKRVIARPIIRRRRNVNAPVPREAVDRAVIAARWALCLLHRGPAGRDAGVLGALIEGRGAGGEQRSGTHAWKLARGFLPNLGESASSLDEGR